MRRRRRSFKRRGGRRGFAKFAKRRPTVKLRKRIGIRL